MDSYDIRFWDIKKIGSGSAARYRVRWAVNGREHCKSFKARPLADGFLTELKDAVRDRRPFDARTGLPSPRNQSGWIRPPQPMPVRIEFDPQSRPVGPRVGSQAKVMVYPGGNLVMNAIGYVRMRIAAVLAYVQ